MLLLWLIFVVVAAELLARNCQIIWPQLRDTAYRVHFYIAVFILAGALAIFAGLNLLDGIRRDWPGDAQVAASAFLVAALSVPFHAVVGQLLFRMHSWRPEVFARPREALTNNPLGAGLEGALSPVCRYPSSCSRDLGDPALQHPSAGGAYDPSISELQMSLRARGFLGRRYLRGVFCENTDRAVTAYQRFHGLVEDGLVGPVTRHHMARPRCGRPDVVEHREKAASEPCIWKNRPVTWKVSNAPQHVSIDDCRQLAATAFGEWEKVCKIEFRQVDASVTADIHISCESEFDFPVLGATASDDPIAYGYPPCPNTLAGRILLDSARDWTLRRSGVQDIYKVILHEIGHAIGLIEHSNEPADVMRPEPLYSDGVLTDHDAQRARLLYQ